MFIFCCDFLTNVLVYILLLFTIDLATPFCSLVLAICLLTKFKYISIWDVREISTDNINREYIYYIYYIYNV